MRSGGRLDKVADRVGMARRPLVGRAGEIAAMVGLVHGAAGGEGGALLISGEAGVGKTVLMREACARVADGTDVVWGSCLPLTSLAVPFLPLASALRTWAAGRGVPVPVLGGSGGDGPAGFDAWLDELCRQRPVLLAVDDLQWADQSTLDVLMYVIAGLAGRRAVPDRDHPARRAAGHGLISLHRQQQPTTPAAGHLEHVHPGHVEQGICPSAPPRAGVTHTVSHVGAFIQIGCLVAADPEGPDPRLRPRHAAHAHSVTHAQIRRP